MSKVVAFFKKEWMEYARTSKLVIVGAIFVVFGLLNPAIAKLTPVILEKFSESQGSSMQIVIDKIDAHASWEQFFKNIPMALIIMVFLFGSILTNELQKGTLIPMITKGLSRYIIFLVKGLNIIVIWSIGYALCFGITYFYNDYYWDNSVMSNLTFAVFCYWLFGVVMISFMMLFSAISSNFSGVLIGEGVLYFGMSIASIAKDVKKFLPINLTDSTSIVNGAETSTYIAAICTSIVLSLVCFIFGGWLFSKKEL